jgi:N-acyl-D-aspartate/D-glutamate deacylase
MEEGAFGMSTGLDYPPGSYADTAELTELSREAARLGGIYHTHVRYALGDRFLDPFREALDIGRGSDVPVHITHFYHRTTSPGSASRMLGLVEDARTEGLDVTFDSYPYNLSSTASAHPRSAMGARRRPRAADGRAPRSGDARTSSARRWGRGATSWGDMWLTNFRSRQSSFRRPLDPQTADMLDRDPGRRHL